MAGLSQHNKWRVSKAPFGLAYVWLQKKNISSGSQNSLEIVVLFISFSFTDIWLFEAAYNIWAYYVRSDWKSSYK